MVFMYADKPATNAAWISEVGGLRGLKGAIGRTQRYRCRASPVRPLPASTMVVPSDTSCALSLWIRQQFRDLISQRRLQRADHERCDIPAQSLGSHLSKT